MPDFSKVLCHDWSHLHTYGRLEHPIRERNIRASGDFIYFIAHNNYVSIAVCLFDPYIQSREYYLPDFNDHSASSEHLFFVS